MDEYYSAIRAFPEPLQKELAQLDEAIASNVQEVRLRPFAPVCFTVRGALQDGRELLPHGEYCRCITPQKLEDCFLSMCHHSVYAYEEELRQGYFTVDGGNRIGVSGNWGKHGFTQLSSLNLRISRWLTCPLPQSVKEPAQQGEHGILIAGPPGSGKTTMLRTLMELLDEGKRNYSVIDERSELLGCGSYGTAQRHRLHHGDVYSRCSKPQAIQMAVRTMNPHVIVCDELAGEEDALAVREGVCAGVTFFASVHCPDYETLLRKPLLKPLLDTGAFHTVLFLENGQFPGKIRSVHTL